MNKDKLLNILLGLCFILIIPAWELTKYGGKMQNWWLIALGLGAIVALIVAIPFIVGKEDKNVD